MRQHTLHPKTAVINQKQKNLSKKSKLDALKWLQTRFPEAFDSSVRIRPLNLGIIDDILAHADEAAVLGISKSKLREALVLFTRRLDYLICLKAKEMRIDLYGQPVAAVSEEDAQSAAIKIRKRIDKNAKNTRKSDLGLADLPKRSKISTPNVFTQTPLQGPETQQTRVRVMSKQRAYDPLAIARLKEKLGISKKLDMENN